MIVMPRAAADDLNERRIRKEVCDERSGSRIPDAHLPKANSVHTLGFERADDLSALLKRALGIVSAHRRPAQIIFRPFSDLRIDEPLVRGEVGGDARVDDGEI